jgi:tetratricopeptide (TPR) repeat protein
VLEKSKNSGDAAYLQSLLPVFQDPAVNVDAKVKQVLPYLPKLEKGDDASLAAALLELGTAAEKAHPDEPKAWSLSADLLYLANRPAEALTRYKKCISLKPKAFSVWDNALTILADQQQAAEMLPLAEKAMDAFPNQPKAYYWYAVAANLLGRPDDALAQIEQANLMAAGNPTLRLDLADQAGVALLAKRDAAAAVTRFEQALALPNATSHPGLQEHYGDALAARGDRSKALEAWKKAYALRKSPALEQKIGGQ